jgi:hypothetical protein
VTRALLEWHVVVEAIARGDQVVTFRKGAIGDNPPAVAGSAFWLYPSWEQQEPAEVKRAWRGELARSNRERPADGTIPVRCRCTVEAVWELVDGDQLAALDAWHLWTRDYVDSRLGWRPSEPLTVLLLRAASLIEPFPLQPDDGNAGRTSWIELAEEPPAADLIPALTDTAFDMRAAAVHETLGAPAGVGA